MPEDDPIPPPPQTPPRTPPVPPPPVDYPRPFPASTPSPGSRIIPTENPDALVSYYVGLFSILPLFGLFMGPFAIWKGRSAKALARERPEVAGKTHASVGIGCGVVGTLFNVLIVLFILMLVIKG